MKQDQVKLFFQFLYTIFIESICEVHLSITFFFIYDFASLFNYTQGEIKIESIQKRKCKCSWNVCLPLICQKIVFG